MKRILILAVALFLSLLPPCRAGLLDDLSRGVLSPSPLSGQQQETPDDSTVIKGLKEALATGTERAVAQVARPDGYFGNQLIKILLPDKMQQVANVLRPVGYQAQVDELVLSMNRAAEKAAPRAAGFFGDAIRQMTVEDARGILRGGETAATRFFEQKTRSRLYDAFRPTVAQSMEQVGTVRAYKATLASYEAVPLASLAGTPALDLDDYVTNKALDGLFTMVAAEERRIRTDPAARTTDLLRKVFGGS